MFPLLAPLSELLSFQQAARIQALVPLNIADQIFELTKDYQDFSNKMENLKRGLSKEQQEFVVQKIKEFVQSK